MLIVLRAALGLTFVIGGIKIAFPPDAAALEAGYIDPATGWISAFFADQITDRLGLEIATFLRWQGLVEIALGALMIAGIFTPVVALALWLLYIVPENLFGKWLFPGLDAVKREIPLLVGAVVYAVAGADRWTWPRGSRPAREAASTAGERGGAAIAGVVG